MTRSAASSLSVVIPAYNEEGNLRATVERVLDAARVLNDELEIIIVNDCSSDKTGEVANSLSAEKPFIHVIHNGTNLGFGGSYKRGTESAQLANLVMIPGDDAYPVESLRRIFEKVGYTQIVMTYTTNMEIRPLGRRAISRGFVIFMNMLFGLKLRYYNGVTVLPTESARSLNPSDGFSYAAENLVRLIKLRNFSYEQVPCAITERKVGQTKAFKIKNIWNVLRGITTLWLDVYLRSTDSLENRQSLNKTSRL